MLLKKLTIMIFLASIISCSTTKPPKLPISKDPIHTQLSQEELTALRNCSELCKQALKKINKNYQNLLLYSKELKAVIESQ